MKYVNVTKFIIDDIKSTIFNDDLSSWLFSWSPRIQNRVDNKFSLLKSKNNF